MIKSRYIIILIMINTHISMSRRYSNYGHSQFTTHSQPQQQVSNNQAGAGGFLFQQTPPWLTYIDAQNPSRVLMTSSQTSTGTISNTGIIGGGSSVTSSSIAIGKGNNGVVNGGGGVVTGATGPGGIIQNQMTLPQAVLASITTPQAGLVISDLFNFIQTCYNNPNIPVQNVAQDVNNISGKFFTVAVLYTNSSDSYNSALAAAIQQQIIQNPNSVTYQNLLNNNIFYAVLDDATENNYTNVTTAMQTNPNASNVFTGTIRSFLSQLSIPIANAQSQPLNGLVYNNSRSYLNSNASNLYWNDAGSQNFLKNINSPPPGTYPASSYGSVLVAPLYYGLFTPSPSNSNYNIAVPSYANIDTGTGGAFSLPNDLICPGFILLNIRPHFQNDILIPSNYSFSISQVAFINLKVPYLILSSLLGVEGPAAFTTAYQNYGSYEQIIDYAIGEAIQIYGNALNSGSM